MSGGTLGVVASSAERLAEGSVDVRREFASSSLTLLWGLSVQHGVVRLWLPRGGGSNDGVRVVFVREGGGVR